MKLNTLKEPVLWLNAGFVLLGYGLGIAPLMGLSGSWAIKYGAILAGVAGAIFLYKKLFK